MYIDKCSKSTRRWKYGPSKRTWLRRLSLYIDRCFKSTRSFNTCVGYACISNTRVDFAWNLNTRVDIASWLCAHFKHSSWLWVHLNDRVDYVNWLWAFFNLCVDYACILNTRVDCAWNLNTRVDYDPSQRDVKSTRLVNALGWGDCPCILTRWLCVHLKHSSWICVHNKELKLNVRAFQTL